MEGCRRCDAQCDECSTHGTSCDVCKWYRAVDADDAGVAGTCVDDCAAVYPPSYLQVLDRPTTERGRCLPCHDECRRCEGPSHVNCSRCENRKVYVDELLAHSDDDDELLANYSITVNDTVRARHRNSTRPVSSD